MPRSLGLARARAQLRAPARPCPGAQHDRDQELFALPREPAQPCPSAPQRARRCRRRGPPGARLPMEIASAPLLQAARPRTRAPASTATSPWRGRQPTEIALSDQVGDAARSRTTRMLAYGHLGPGSVLRPDRARAIAQVHERARGVPNSHRRVCKFDTLNPA